MGEKNRNSHDLKNYARYSGMAFQMGIIISIGTYCGVKLDEKLGTKPWLTLACVLFAIAIALYSIIKDFFPTQKK